MELLDNVNTASDNLRELPYHPHSKKRVIVLDPPYELPKGMDLRGIAGVVLKQKQNVAIARHLENLTATDFKALQNCGARFAQEKLQRKPGYGPRPPPPLPGSPIAETVEQLAKTFQRLTQAEDVNIHFSAANATDFHIDGSNSKPSWRLTYAFTGAQTIWHSYIKDKETPVIAQGGTGFPQLPKNKIGNKGIDYFEAEGALMFLTYSPNGLFHKTPDGQNDRRLVVTIDANAPQRMDCTGSCPFPCR